MPCPFSKYSEIFGKQNEGVHSIRFLDVAAVDYFLSILGAIILSFFTKIPLVLTTIVILVLGIILHMLFGVNTSAVKYLGLDCNKIKII